jgi:hypothetical protein
VDTVGKAASHAVTATGTVTSYAIAPALTLGLSLNTTTGLISGTPTGTLVSTAYVVTATGPGGTGTAGINITIAAQVVGLRGLDTPGSGFTVRSFGKGLLFGLPATSSPVEISIMDVWGRTVWSRSAKGSAELIWDGRVPSGRQAAKGVYIVRMGKPGEPNSPALEKVITYAP